MIENRELTMDDYLAMLRRRVKVILVPALLAPIAGFLISYAFSPKYTSQSQVQVETQQVPEGYVKPMVTEDLSQRVLSLQQQVLAPSRLKPMIERLGLAKGGKSVEEVADDIQKNVSIDFSVPDYTAKKKTPSKSSADVPGFYENYTASNPREAQNVCSELTSMLLEENLKARAQIAQSTTDFLARQVDEAKKNLDDLDSKLAGFKRQYMGQLPGDEDNNIKLLMGMNSQLDANTQSLNRAQQDKSYAESLLAQQLAAWKSTQTSTNPQTLEQQLAQLQSQLITLQARYTDDHPDVVKTKNDIAELKRKLDEMNTAAAQNTGVTDKSTASEPPEIRQLRLQIHQYGEAIAQASREQKRLQDQIHVMEGRVALSPGIEEQYKSLTRDYDTAQKFYNDLLAKKSDSAMVTDMERRQQGEQLRLLTPANLPDSPSFPLRWMFAAGGGGAGLVIGMALALWLELRDKAIRTEPDVMAALELTTLVSVPWIGAEGNGKGGYGKYGRSAPAAEEKKKETVEV